MPAAPAAALGVSFQVDLGQGMGVVFQTHIDATQAMNGSLDKLLDRLFDAGRRQRAKPELDALTVKIETERRQVENYDVQIEAAEHTHTTEVAKLQEGIVKSQQRKAEIDSEAREAHRARGDRGPYKATAQAGQKMSGYDSEIAKARQEMLRLNAVKEDALRNVGHARDVSLDLIAKLEAEIKERKDLLAPSG